MNVNEIVWDLILVSNASCCVKFSTKHTDSGFVCKFTIILKIFAGFEEKIYICVAFYRSCLLSMLKVCMHAGLRKSLWKSWVHLLSENAQSCVVSIPLWVLVIIPHICHFSPQAQTQVRKVRMHKCVWFPSLCWFSFGGDDDMSMIKTFYQRMHKCMVSSPLLFLVCGGDEDKGMMRPFVR